MRHKRTVAFVLGGGSALRRPAAGPEPDERAWQAQVRLYHRCRHLTEHGKRSTVANVAVARELVGFLWAAMTDQPLRATDANHNHSRRSPPSKPPPSPSSHFSGVVEPAPDGRWLGSNAAVS